MAVKYYCDGCDKRMYDDQVRRVSVSVKKNGDFSASGGAYEVCDTCEDQLKRCCNPHNWTRAANRASA